MVVVQLEVSHQGVPLGHAEFETEGLAIGEFKPGNGYAQFRDVIREASRAIWGMGFFHPEKTQPRVAVEDLAAAARLQFELRDDKGALVHSDFVNIVEPPSAGAPLLIMARFQQSHAGKPTSRSPGSRGDGSAAPDA